MTHNNDIEEEDMGSMTKPFDPSAIKVRLEPISIYSMCERIRYGEVALDTKFQRAEGLWKAEQQSRLIESILIQFPLPVFYFDGSNKNNWLVIDGLQRLSTLKYFIVDQTLALTGLEFLHHLEGKTWSDLARPLQRQINETNLQCYILDDADPDVKFNIFKRINTGGLVLSDQEIRHAMHQDVAPFLQDLANLSAFKKATRNKIKPDRMLDRDFVNRFLAFYLLDYNKDYSYEDDLNSFMNRALDILSQKDESELNFIKKQFNKSMLLARKVFKDYAFSKSQKVRRINKALFEVIAVAFSKLTDQESQLILERKHQLATKLETAIDGDFGKALSSNTGGKSNIVLRHETFQKIIQQTLAD